MRRQKTSLNLCDRLLIESTVRRLDIHHATRPYAAFPSYASSAIAIQHKDGSETALVMGVFPAGFGS
jgi:hypothetical protein